MTTRLSFSWVPLLGLFAPGAACCHQQTVPAGTTISCPPNEQRVERDCSMAFNLDSTNIQGTLSAFNFLSAGGKTSTAPIRQVNDQLMGYAFRRQELCKDWNACNIDAATYQSVADKMEAQITSVAALRPQAEQASQSNNYDAGMATLGQIQSQATFTLEFAAFALFPKDPNAVPDKPCPPDIQPDQRYELLPPKVIAAGDTLPTGTHAAFNVRSTAPVYLYLLQRKGSTGALQPIFPDPQIPVPNPIPANQVVSIPPSPASYCLDQNDVGTDRVFVVASLVRLDSLDSAIQQINAGNVQTIQSANATVQAIDSLPTTVSQLPDSCVRSRAFVLDTSGAPPASPAGPQACPPKSRGFVLDSHGSNPGSQTSFSAMSDPGQNGLLVKVFPYVHAAKGAAEQADTGPRRRDIMIEQ